MSPNVLAVWLLSMIFHVDIPKGSMCSIIGPNGAGKTTFFNCVSGFYSIDEGDIVFCGEIHQGTIPGRDRAHRNITHLPEHPLIRQYDHH